MKNYWISMVQTQGFILLLLILGTGGCDSNPNPSAIEEQTTEADSEKSEANANLLEFTISESLAALEVVYENGQSSGQLSILETLGGGVGVQDFDKNGLLDMVFPGGGSIEPEQISGLPTRFLRQVSRNQFEDASQASLVAPREQYSQGVACGDYNSDGFQDVLITGYGGLTLWQNNGDGTFSDVTEQSGLHDEAWSSSAAWGDFDQDGHLDLYVAHYVNWSFENHPQCFSSGGVADVCGPRDFQGLDDTLYRNLGDGTFEVFTEAAGLLPGGKGLGVILGDFDVDADLDIYVANDTVPNFLYQNDGTGKFDEMATIAGVGIDDMANPNGSMGLAVTDFNQDSLPDLFVTNYEEEMTAYYRNLGQMSFLYESRKAGLNRLGTLYVGFGCVSGDYDADGDEDIAIANGHVIYHPTNTTVEQTPLLLLNQDQGIVQAEVPSESYFNTKQIGRGLATGDLNRDGKLDLVFVNTLAPSVLLLGQTTTTAKSYLLHLVGTKSNRSAIGTTINFVTDQRERTRFQVTGMGYLSSSPNEVYVAIPADESLQQIKISWPSGQQTTHSIDDCRRLSSSKSEYEFVIVEPN